MPRRPRNIDRNKDNFVPFVDTLKGMEFQKTIDTKKAAFVMFYHPQSTICKAVRQPFVTVASITGSKYRGFYAFDCEKDPDFCASQCVTRYPSFKLYVMGRYLNDYDSAVTVETMKTFVEKAPVPGMCCKGHPKMAEDEVFCRKCLAESMDNNL